MVNTTDPISKSLTFYVPCTRSRTVINDSIMTLPPGMMLDNITQDSVSQNEFTFNFRWNTRLVPAGLYQLCVKPVDSEGHIGDQVCTTLQVRVDPPKFLSMAPTGLVLDTQSDWTISMDQNVAPPIRSDVYFRFFKRAVNGTGQEVLSIDAETATFQLNTISFTTNGTIWEQVSYSCGNAEIDRRFS